MDVLGEILERTSPAYSVVLFHQSHRDKVHLEVRQHPPVAWTHYA